ncbi:MAG: GNAT family N-acetyltransferase, partial [Nitrospira sp.]|nr:GNAT family N-acetyltransferase [Nitrospira sp.]
TLAQWHHAEWSSLNPGDSVGRRIARLQSQKGRRQIPTTFIALRGETLLGSASLIAHDMDTRMGFSPWLASVYVAPEYRRSGVGSALVQRVVEEARALGVKLLYLFTTNKESFYARLGWSVLERTEYRGKPVVIMTI